MAWYQVIREPIIREASYNDADPTLRADLAVRGVWLPQSEALLDIRVTDTDAQSYQCHSPMEDLRFDPMIDKCDHP